MKVFGIFEGGGVRGYAHVGALRALERRDIEFEAVAGTSIGAIVAALVAAEYKADELYVEQSSGVSGIAAVSIDTFLSAHDVKIFRRVRKDLDLYKKITCVFRRLRLPSPFDVQPSCIFVAVIWFMTPFVWISTPLAYFRHWRALSRLWRRFGLAETETARGWLDDALRRKIDLGGAQRQLVFGDLPIPLRVIVGDVKTGTMRVAGADKNEPLVDAVLASASFPLFFVPNTADGNWLVDGGIVSNLPAWVFDRERAASPVCIPTIALRLAGPEDKFDRALLTLARFVPRLLSTVLDGARELQFRRIDDHHLITLPAEIDVLAFHEMEAKRAIIMKAGERAVDNYFATELGPVDPQHAASVLGLVAAHTRQLLQTSAVVRAWVLIDADEEYVRVAFAANMNQDADDQLLIRRGSPGAALVFERKEPVLVNVPTVASAFGQDPLYKYEHAARAQTVKTICALPIFADPNDWSRAPYSRAAPIAALGLDLDEESKLAFLSASVEDRLATYAQIVGERLRHRIVAQFQPGPEAPAVAGQSDLEPIAPGVEVYQRKTRSLVFDDDTAKLITEMGAA